MFRKIIKFILPFTSELGKSTEIFKYRKYNEDELFSIGFGEICEDCLAELELESGGFSGRKTKCQSCKIIKNRNSKLEQLGL